MIVHINPKTHEEPERALIALLEHFDHRGNDVNHTEVSPSHFVVQIYPLPEDRIFPRKY